MMWNNGWNSLGMVFMTVGNLVFWGLVIAGIILLVRYVDRGARSARNEPPPATPQQILAQRFAHGDIDEEEYMRRLDLLKHTSAPGSGS